MNIKTILRSDFLKHLKRSKSGIAGLTIILLLLGISVYTAVQYHWTHSDNGIIPTTGSSIQNLRCHLG